MIYLIHPPGAWGLERSPSPPWVLGSSQDAGRSWESRKSPPQAWLLWLRRPSLRMPLAQCPPAGAEAQLGVFTALPQGPEAGLEGRQRPG